MRNLLLALLLLASLSHSDFYVSEGGNVTSLGLNTNNRTIYWAGITGWMNTTAPFNPDYPIGYQPIGVSGINSTYANGTWYGSPMVATRLAFRPGLPSIRSPTTADISTGGMFDNFTVFNGKDFTTFADSPLFTFVGAVTATCQLGSQAFSCAQITLAGPTPLWLLVYDNGTHEEPLFISNITSTTGYNGTIFDFQYMAPVLEGYFFYIYGIAPSVTIIAPEPITYGSNAVPFTYTVASYYTLDSCWYILDSTRFGMPDCTSSYMLNVADGAHTLALYANDSEGQTGSDSVSFTVTTEAPATPGGGGGPGGPHIPQPTPEVPPVTPPAYDYFTISPEDIRVTIDYPYPGGSSFFLYSKYKMIGVECVVTGEFAKYSAVELVSNEVGEGGALDGKIIVEIPPEILIDYKGGREGLLQCIGRSTVNSSLSPSASANVYLEINEPRITVENITVEIYPGQTINTTILLNNTGQGNASTYLFAAQFEGELSGLITITQLPGTIRHGEEGVLPISISVAPGFPTGEYAIPVLIYENGKLIGSGGIKLKVKEGIYLPVGICAFPALSGFYVFYDALPVWSSLMLLAIANYALLKWRKRHTWQIRLLVSALPALLSLPGIWVFAPCFMMNLAVLQFITTFLWKLLHGQEGGGAYAGRKQEKKPHRSEGKAEEGKG